MRKGRVGLFLGVAVVVILIQLPSVEALPKPLTGLIYGGTAYTLSPGEVEIGSLDLAFWIPYGSFSFEVEQFKWVWISLGFTERLQLGTTLLENFLEGPNLSGRWVLVSIPSSGLGVALPFSFDLNLSPFAIGMGSGLIFSKELVPSFGFHSGLHFWFSSGGGFRLTMLYLGMNLTFSPSMSLLAEFDYWPQVQKLQIPPFDLGVGFLFRVSFLDLRLFLDVPFQDFLLLKGRLTLRF